jgi:hypothetical protein
LGNAHWFATPENEWATLFRGFVPEWLEPQVHVLDGTLNTWSIQSGGQSKWVR